MTSTCLKRPGHQKIENTDSKPVLVPTLQVLLNQPDTDHPSTPIAMSTNPEAVATATVVTRAHAAREAQGTNQTDFNNRSSQNDLQSSIATIQQQLIELEIETTSLTERRDAASHGQLIQPHERGGSLHTPPHQQPMHASTPSDALHLMELRAARAEATLNASRLRDPSGKCRAHFPNLLATLVDNKTFSNAWNPS